MNKRVAVSGRLQLPMILTLALPVVAGAQTTAAPAVQGSDSGGLQEIVVTAQKRSESAVDVPISIVAVSGETLRDAGVTDISALQQLVPSLRIDFSGPSAQPTIRGVGSALLGPGLSPNVATYVDGVIRPSTFTQDLYFMDVDSIQVLQGPQGTLFGRNATGGAILVNSAEPSFTPEASGRISYGSYHTVDTSLAGSTGITDTVAVSIAAFRSQSDGFVTNLVNGADAGQYDNYGVRAKVLWRPSDAVKFTFSYEHVATDDNRAIALGAYNGWSDGVLAGGVAPDYRGTVALNFPSISTSNYDESNLKGEFDLGWATLTSLTAGQWEQDHESTDNDASSAPLVGVDWKIKDRTISQEFDLASAKNDSLTWVAGFYYYNNSSEWPVLYVSADDSPLFPVFGGSLKTESYAEFADATKQLGEQWFATLGLRDESDHVYEEFQSDTPAGSPQNASKTWNNVTPRAVLRYQLEPDSNVYASFTRGYKSGVFNVPGESTTPVDPEKISAFEIGYKTAHHTWKLDAAAFYYDYKDLQITTYTALGSVLVNAASSKIYGLDLNGEFQVTDHLSVQTAGTWLHAHYTNFQNAPDYTWNPTTGVNIGSIDASGFQMERSPEFSGNIGLRYVQTVFQGEAALSGWYSYTTRVYFDPADVTYQKGYGLLNARAQWTAPSGKWDVAVFGKNLTNVRYINQVLPNTAYFGETWGEPAVFGIELGFKF